MEGIRQAGESLGLLEIPRAARPRVWLWPNLISLDAPVVAVLWQMFFARCFGVRIDFTLAALLMLSVWLIYVADRVLDAHRRPSGIARHQFYELHWRAFAPFWIAALLAAAWLALTRITPAIFKDGIALMAAILMYFAIVHILAPRRKWPKELAVAVLFTLGASLIVWRQVRTATDAAIIVLFGALCWINCAAIERWEGRSLTAWPVREASILVGLAALVFLYDRRPIVAGAETASAFAFVLLDRAKDRLSADALRVLADVALLTPLLFLPITGLR